jgi:multiple sugar transport system permease protein
MKSGTSRRSLLKHTLLYCLLAVVLAWTLTPLFWMVLSSFKGPSAITASTPQLFFEPTLENYSGILAGAGNLLGNVKNSLIATGAATVISVVLGSLGGYGLARSRMRGKHHLSFWIISTRMAPIAAVIVPLYILFLNLNLLDTLPGLTLAYLTFNLPFAIWIMSAFFADLPPALEEAAKIDGASRFRAFWNIALPLVKPGIATTSILCFLFAWNDYAFARTFSGPNSQTIPIAAARLVTQTGVDWGVLTAIGTIVVLPMIIAGLVVRRYLVAGLTLGAVRE